MHGLSPGEADDGDEPMSGIYACGLLGFRASVRQRR